MGTPITKAATVMCNLGGKVNLSAVSSKIKIDGNDVVDKADIGLPVIGCPGHLPPPNTATSKCIKITVWNDLLTSLQDQGQPVVGNASGGPVAKSNILIADITCSDPGNEKLFVD